MPYYLLITQEGFVSAKQKATIASGITQIHCANTGAPEKFVRTIFQTYPEGSAFVAGDVAASTVLVGSIRLGRTLEVQETMLRAYWELLETTLGTKKDQLLVILEDVPAGQVMEYGAILPEPGHEDSWIAEHA